jgi:dTDP-4-dehydrorhamnose 3,5-epimerase-like enzyme
MDFTDTRISGVKIIFEKIISDMRGTFFDLVENGFNEIVFNGGVVHVYATVTKSNRLARGNHYHFENFENFFPLTGTGLWVLMDCRKESKTYGNIFSFITSYNEFKDDSIPVFSIKNKQFVHFTVPPGVYHLVAPLTDEPLVSIAFGSIPFKEEDVGHPEEELLERINSLISKYGITHL